MNACVFSGRMGGDAATRYTTNNKSITNFSLALDVGWGDRKHTLWLSCNCWGERWEKLAPHLTKGTSVVVSGSIDLREYERRDGAGMGTSLDLDVKELAFVGSKEDGGGQQRTGTGETGGGFRKDPAPKQGSFDTEKTPDGDFEEDSIPF